MEKKRAFVIANGYLDELTKIKDLVFEDDFVICVDGGLMHADKYNITPDCIIGDLDSVDENILQKYIDIGTTVIKYPVDKDYTDLELAIKFIIENDFTDVCIFGATGGRFDHTLGNIHSLRQLVDNNIKVWVIDSESVITLINSSIEFKDSVGITVSLIPLTTKVEGVVTEGFKYPLNDETLYVGSSRGLSNIIEKEVSKVSIKSGYLIIFKKE